MQILSAEQKKSQGDDMSYFLKFIKSEVLFRSYCKNSIEKIKNLTNRSDGEKYISNHLDFVKL